MTTPRDNFEQQVRDVLEESVSRIDDTTLGQLAAARCRALDPVERQRGFGRWFLPAAGALAAAMLLVLVFYWGGRPQYQQAAGDYLLDAEIIDSPENLELLQDMDFYVWLTEESNNGAG